MSIETDRLNLARMKISALGANLGTNIGEVNQVEIEVTDASFQRDVIDKSRKIPVVVDFWAPWCMPCRIIGPILERLAHQYNGKFVLAKINVDANRQAAAHFGIRSIPSVKMFRDGKIVDEFLGAIPEPMIRQWLDKNL